jgi:HPt (histidine-containing phosphotransfer) domain-containing protein
MDMGVTMGQVMSAISFSDLLSLVDDDRAFVDELLVLFCDQLDPLMRTLNEAVIHADVKQVEVSAHTLSGMLANLSAPQAQASAATLEQLGRERESAGFASAFATLQRDLDAVTASIRSYMEESHA